MLHLVVALECEARPLAARHRLKLSKAEHPCRIYEGEGARLVVSGVGKAAAAGASGYLQGVVRQRHGVWLNVGIAGHRDRPVGQGFLAHKVVDGASGRSWYPPLLFRPASATETVLTVDRPERRYREGAAYDMEAAGFLAAASRFTTAELVHVYKVVSDGLHHPVDELSARKVERLVEGALDDIDSVLLELAGLAAELEGLGASPAGLDEFLERWHFTVSERRRLRRVLQRLEIVDPGWKPGDLEPTRRCRGRDVLRELEDRLNALPVRVV